MSANVCLSEFAIVHNMSQAQAHTQSFPNDVSHSGWNHVESYHRPNFTTGRQFIGSWAGGGLSVPFLISGGGVRGLNRVYL